MLAQNFKTAADLKLTEAQWRALVLALGALERDEVTHVTKHKIRSFQKLETSKPLFNMDFWSEMYPCGTICCIGGTAEALGSLARYELDRICDTNEALHELFYPDSADRERISIEQAARALRSYLTTGEANWAEALSASQRTGARP